jgi:hypothetical protein
MFNLIPNHGGNTILVVTQHLKYLQIMEEIISIIREIPISIVLNIS